MSVDPLPDFATSHAEWHKNLEAQRASEYGPLSITAIHWLDAESRELAGLPGTWSATDDGLITLTATPADRLAVGDEPVDGTITIGPLTGVESTIVEWNVERENAAHTPIRIQVAARSGKIAVRPHDPASTNRAEYAGTNTFPANPAWVVNARYEANPRAGVEVDTAISWGKQHYDSPGRAVFEVDGQEYSLTLFGTDGSNDLRANFADATGADLTYPAVRFVGATRIGESTVVIDFNRAVNPPCAYSTNATCPFPPPENRLPIRIEAGELRPGVSL